MPLLHWIVQPKKPDQAWLQCVYYSHFLSSKGSFAWYVFAPRSVLCSGVGVRCTLVNWKIIFQKRRVLYFGLMIGNESLSGLNSLFCSARHWTDRGHPMLSLCLFVIFINNVQCDFKNLIVYMFQWPIFYLLEHVYSCHLAHFTAHDDAKGLLLIGFIYQISFNIQTFFSFAMWFEEMTLIVGSELKKNIYTEFRKLKYQLKTSIRDQTPLAWFQICPLRACMLITVPWKWDSDILSLLDYTNWWPCCIFVQSPCIFPRKFSSVLFCRQPH